MGPNRLAVNTKLGPGSQKQVCRALVASGAKGQASCLVGLFGENKRHK